jgi:carboxymethylenebutenolidase
MKKFAVAMLALVFAIVFASTAFAATGKQVSYKSGDETVNGILYEPSGSGPFPALVVIHEWWGLNDQIKGEASNFSDQGYVTLAIDLYRGKVATTPDEAHEIMRGVPEDRANRDLLAATAYLRSLKNVNPAKVGAVGWCMGGGYALDLAIADPKLAAVAINYGHLATEADTLKKINASVLGNFGGQDRGIPPESVNAFSDALKKLGKSVDVKIYPDAGHAFENPNNKTGYRAADAADAQQRMDHFFAATLKK